MDRFIANIVDVGREVLGDLKSSMDRFIDFTYHNQVIFNQKFKIQYG